MSLVRLSRDVPLLQQPPGQNDCGPYATAMAVGYYLPDACDPDRIAQQMRFLRVPAIGATLPWGITTTLARYGLVARGGWLNSLAALRQNVAADHPTVVIVKPTDFAGCPWYALHYRIVVGYRDDPALPGGGELHFNCSASPPRPSVDDLPGNLTVDYTTFRGQWRTYLTFDWAVAVLPG